MPKFTVETIESELAALEQSEAIAAPYYLRQELRRRKNAGVKPSSPLDRRGQNREAQKRFREKTKKKLDNKHK